MKEGDFREKRRGNEKFSGTERQEIAECDEKLKEGRRGCERYCEISDYGKVAMQL